MRARRTRRVVAGERGAVEKLKGSSLASFLLRPDLEEKTGDSVEERHVGDDEACAASLAGLLGTDEVPIAEE